MKISRPRMSENGFARRWGEVETSAKKLAQMIQVPLREIEDLAMLVAQGRQADFVIAQHRVETETDLSASDRHLRLGVCRCQQANVGLERLRGAERKILSRLNETEPDTIGAGTNGLNGVREEHTPMDLAD